MPTVRGIDSVAAKLSEIALIREYVWLNWEPIAVIEGGVTYLVRNDHIGRPVFATNTSGVKVWTATYDPFGGVRTPTGTPINARFPGQWFQSESGLHQNWMRDYDPTTGRYLQADPLGLVDGASVYGYARQSPMMYTDPRGEFAFLAAVPWFFGLVTGGTGAAAGGASLTGVAIGATVIVIGTTSPAGVASEGGLGTGSSPYDKVDEQDAIDFMPDPFGGGNYCERLKYAINVLRANLTWRAGDLNRASISYRGHLARIGIMKAQLEALEANYRLVCGGECPWE